MLNSDLTLLVCGSVIDPRPVRLSWSAGRSIAELVQALAAEGLLPAALLAEDRIWQLYVVIAHPDARIVPVAVSAERWRWVRPKAGMVISLAVRPGRGSGGGGKNPLRTLLSIAVVAASFAVGAWVSGLAAEGIFGGALQGTFASKLIGGLAGGLVTMVGNTLVNSIAPAPQPTLSGLQGRFLSERQSLSAQQRAVSGTRNVADPFGPVPQVLGRQRVAPRLAAEPFVEAAGDDTFLRLAFVFGVGPCRMSNIRIGPTPIEEMEDYELELREGWMDDAPLALYPDTPRSQQVDRSLVYDEPVRVSVREAREAVLEWSFPLGLVYFDLQGNRNSTSVRFRVEYRPDGGAGWTELALEDLSGVSELPQIRTRRYVLPEEGDWEFQVTRLTAAAASTQTRNDSRLAGFKAIRPKSPIGVQGLACGAIRYKTGEDFHDVVDELTAEVEALVYYPDDEGVWDWRFTDNPAWLAFHVLTGRANRRARPAEQVDVEAFRAFAAFCAEVPENGDGPRFRYGHLVDYRTSVTEKAQQICATARGQLVKLAGKWSVVWDAPKGAADAVVAPQDCWGWSRRISYVDLPHGLRVRYEDEERSIQEVIVYRTGYGAANATLFEVIEIEGCAAAEQAYREGTYWFEVAQRRRATTYLSTNIRHLTYTLGSLVRVAHPVPRWGVASADIVSVALDGLGRVTAITLDRPVPMEAGKEYCVRVRLPAGGSVYELVETVPGERVTLTLAAPIARMNPADADSGPKPGDLVLFGERGWETRRLICKRITRLNADLDARVEFVDEAPEVHTVEQEPIPAHVTTGPADPRANAPGVVVNLQLDEVITFNGATPYSTLRVRWQPADGSLPAGYEIYRMGDDGRFVYQLPVVAARWELTGLALGERVRLAVLAVGRTGGRLPIEEAAIAEITIRGDVELPGDLRRLTVEETVRGTRRFAAEFDTAVDHAGFRFRYHAGSRRDWAGALALHDGLVTALPFETDRLATGSYTVLAKAVDTSGNESRNPAVVTVNLGDRLVANVVQQVDLAEAGFLGGVVGGAVEDGAVIATDPGTPLWSEWAIPFWYGDAQPFWTSAQSLFWVGDAQPFWSDDAAPMWQAIYNALRYTDAFTAEGPGILTIEAEGQGGLSIEYRAPGGRPFWLDTAGPFWRGDAEPFWSEDDWKAYSGPVRTSEGAHDVRVSIPTGTIRGRIDALTVTIDLEDDVQTVEDLVIVAEGTRLPLARPMRSVKALALSIQHDGGDAVTFRVIDKNPISGPLVQLLDAALVPTSGLIDATIQGVRR